MTQPAGRRTPLNPRLPGRPAIGLAIAGIVAVWLVLLSALVTAIASSSPLNPVELLILPVLCGGVQPAKRTIQQLGGGRRVRMSRHTTAALTKTGG